jgi:cobyrinic acid a,c-diamide synthase
MRRGLVLAAAASGAGKTVAIAGLLRALSQRGVSVRGAKSGPDYIDPAFHRAATGHDSVNLDTWAMAPALLDALAAGSEGELLLIEGAMGLFDGAVAGPGRTGAAAELAAHFDLPVLLVLDISGQAQTAAALVRGLATHDRRVKIAGVILNRVASERHRRLAADAIAAAGFPVLGAIPRDAAVALPSRHLGLVQADEHDDLEARMRRIAEVVARHVDLDAILAAAGPLAAEAGDWHAALPPPGSRIALARDEAFSFIYPHVLAGWRRANAEIVAFSPLADEAPPDDCDACWLPGGYPELHAGRLAGATRFRDGLAAFSATRRVHGECGGHMVLGRWLEGADGVRHPMTGLLGHATSFARRRLTLGYRAARLLADCSIGRKGSRVRGHEFHYSTLAEAGEDAPLAEMSDAAGASLGPAGGRRGQVTGSWFHAIARG